MPITQIIQIIQDYYPDRIQLGTMPADCIDIEHAIGVDARKIAFAINKAAEYSQCEAQEAV